MDPKQTVVIRPQPDGGEGGAAKRGAAGPTRVDPRLQHATSLPIEPALTRLEAGTRIGQYELIRPIGRGGMGQVYLARDVTLGRRVAIKFLLDADAELRGRLLIEARATARCQHEQIVVIHEVNEYLGYPFLVLEYLEGETLDRLLARGTLAPERAIELTLPVLRALAHAHAAGIVHRDLKPENVFLTESGGVKVLDFGIAKAFEVEAAAAGAAAADSADGGDGADGGSPRVTKAGTVVGTPPYMSPEQLRGDEVDGRTDIWAVGILLHEMLTGQHPLGADLDRRRLRDEAWDLTRTMPSAAVAGPSLGAELVAVIDRCLCKAADGRYPGAAELLAALEALLPSRREHQLDDGACPYPGLSSFGEKEANRFFGRAADVRRAVARLEEHPMLGLIGPSGAGKSSFVRAGLIPALKHADQPWEVITLRPGRDPLAGLAELARSLDGAGDAAALASRLRAEPGTLGELLRRRARARGGRILLFVDQFEELFTLVAAAEDRAAVLAALAAVADDVAAPLRLIVSLRSDFLDRLSGQQGLLGMLTQFLFLAPLDRAGLREALVRPAAMAGYAFESEELVEEMIDALEQTAGALPLLQFAAARLWDGRDRAARRLTAASYARMGGVAGAIASHADQVVADLPPAAQREVRRIFQRLVTPERTRALADLRELGEASADAEATRGLVDQLVRARLLVVSGEGDDATVEIVHESLIGGWPRLARWIEEEAELVAFQAQLRTNAKQWDDRGRPQGLLWRGESLDEARRLRQRFAGLELAARERDFLDTAFALEDRARRNRRRALIAAAAALLLVAVGAFGAMLRVSRADREALRQSEQARLKAEQALEAEHAAAEAQARADAEQAGRRVAEDKAKSASAEVVAKDEDLKTANQRLERALEEQKREAAKAREAQAAAERDAAKLRAAESELRAKQRQLEELLAEKQEQVDKLEAQLKKISTDLK